MARRCLLTKFLSTFKRSSTHLEERKRNVNKSGLVNDSEQISILKERKKCYSAVADDDYLLSGVKLSQIAGVMRIGKTISNFSTPALLLIFKVIVHKFQFEPNVSKYLMKFHPEISKIFSHIIRMRFLAHSRWKSLQKESQNCCHCSPLNSPNFLFIALGTKPIFILSSYPAVSPRYIEIYVYREKFLPSISCDSKVLDEDFFFICTRKPFLQVAGSVYVSEMSLNGWEMLLKLPYGKNIEMSKQWERKICFQHAQTHLTVLSSSNFNPPKFRWKWNEAFVDAGEIRRSHDTAIDEEVEIQLSIFHAIQIWRKFRMLRAAQKLFFFL